MECLRPHFVNIYPWVLAVIKYVCEIYVFVAAKAAWNLEKSKVSGAPSHTLNEMFKDFKGFCRFPGGFLKIQQDFMISISYILEWVIYYP